MTNEASLTTTRQKKIDKLKTALKKTRAAERKTQRQEQAKRLQKVAEALEGAAGRKVSPREAELAALVVIVGVGDRAPEEIAGVLLRLKQIVDPAADPQGRATIAGEGAAFLATLAHPQRK